MFGLLNVNKPAGITSRDAVDHIQRQLPPRTKAGHAGTLDPLATGVLVVCVGPATRLISYVQQMEKSYRGTFLMGRRSPTDDTDGQVEELKDAPVPTRADVQRVLPRFLGDTQQVPPAYSALKVAGRRAYSLARAGAPPQLGPRKVHIRKLELVTYDYPQLTLDVRCGSGTYVRAVGRDVAAALGTAAVMSALQRTAIGRFRLTTAVALGEITKATAAGLLLPPQWAVSDLPKLQLTDEQIRLVGRGQPIESGCALRAAEVAAVDTHGQLVAILVPRGTGRYGPTKNFVGSR